MVQLVRRKPRNATAAGAGVAVGTEMETNGPIALLPAPPDSSTGPMSASASAAAASVSMPLLAVPAGAPGGGSPTGVAAGPSPSPSGHHCAHCLGGAGECACGYGCAAPRTARCVARHLDSICDGCGARDIAGALHSCGRCVDNVTLCAACYGAGAHDEMHPFVRWSRPGAVASRLAARVSGGAPMAAPAPRPLGVAVAPHVPSCSVCLMMPPRTGAPRFSCAQCEDIDLCEACYVALMHAVEHEFILRAADPTDTQTLAPRSEWPEKAADVGRPSAAHCKHCAGWAAPCACSSAPRCRVPPGSRCFHAHSSRCSACKTTPVPGALFTCGRCPSPRVSLCSSCYSSGAHDAGHPFVRRDSPDSAPIRLTPRRDGGNPHPLLPVPPGRNVVSHRASCSACDAAPLRGVRLSCAQCTGVHLCEACYDAGMHEERHSFDVVHGALARVQRVPPRARIDARPSASHCAHCAGWAGACACPAKCPVSPGARCLGCHDNVVCSKCSASPIIGARYSCGRCPDVSLCVSCYSAGAHDITHPFTASERNGAPAIVLMCRAQGGSIVKPPLPGALALTNWGISCAACGVKSFKGDRYECRDCDFGSLCEACYHAGMHDLRHAFSLFSSLDQLPWVKKPQKVLRPRADDESGHNLTPDGTASVSNSSKEEEE